MRSLKSCAILRPADFSPAARKSTLGGGSLVGGSANHDCDTLTSFTAGRGGSVTGTQSALLILTAALTSSWLGRVDEFSTDGVFGIPAVNQT